MSVSVIVPRTMKDTHANALIDLSAQVSYCVIAIKYCVMMVNTAESE